MKYLVFVFDGLADFPDENSPLRLAKKPNIDYLSSKGLIGRLRLIEEKDWNENTRASVSHIANTSFLGYNPKKFRNERGVLEAISAGLEYKNGWLSVRCDFGTLEKGIIIDRRAGRNTFGLDILERDINENIDIGVKFVFKRTYGHRAVLLIKEKLSDKIQLNDPLSPQLPPKEIIPLNKDAEKTANIIKDFVEKTSALLMNHKVNRERKKRGILPANYLLLREPGNKLKYFKPKFVKKYKVKAIAISEPGVMKATCMLAGFDVLDIFEEFDYKKGLKFIFEKIEELLSEYDFIYTHIKWTDEAAHDKDSSKKRSIIEEFDRYLENYRNFEGKIMITTDHITSCKTGKHEFGDVPFLISPCYNLAKKKKFDELSALSSIKLTPKKLWEIFFS
ncbi:MAG: hypothetical protein QXX30_03665 [Candidatus Aenigmatarchaeota archaeon]